jgi:hypothetical protein
MSACSSCGAPLRWAQTEKGALMPLELAELERPGVGRVVYNPQTRRCRVLGHADLAAAAQWMAQGATLHLSHWASCPHAVQHRVSDGQLALDDLDGPGVRRPLAAAGGEALVASGARPGSRRGQPDRRRWR